MNWWPNRRKKEEQLDAEVCAHLEMAARDHAHRGQQNKQAEQAARREFGNVELVKQTARDVRGWEWLERLWLDLRYVARALRKSPGFSAVAILTLALGIGANTAIFSVIHGVLLAPLPYKQSQRILEVHSGNEAFKGFSLGLPLGDAAVIKKDAPALEELTIYDMLDKNVTGEGEPQAIEAVQVANNFFAFLGAGPALGRFFTEEEHRPATSRVAVLSDKLWRSRFGSNPKVLGKTLRLDTHDYVIVGVTKPAFRFPSKEVEAWLPLAPDPKDALDHASHSHQVLARLEGGATLEQANEELKTIAGRIEKEFPTGFGGWTLHAVYMQQSEVKQIRPALLILFAAVTLVLLIACVNVANLLLARGWQRHKEMALRAALGASRWRIARLLLSESVLLGSVGGALGLVLANWGVAVFARLAPPDTPRIDQLHADWTMVAFSAACALLAGIAFGMLPATQAVRWDPNTALKETGSGAAPSRQRLRDGLAVLEIALALPLLVSSALLIRGFSSLTHTETGFRTDHLILVSVNLPDEKYPKESEQRLYARRVLEEVRGVPGVEDVAISNSSFWDTMALTAGLQIAGEPASDQGMGNIETRSVSAGYFHTMNIPVLRGRGVTEQDDENGARVAVISLTMAREAWKGRDPLGTRLSYKNGKDDKDWIVVGIVGDTRDVSLAKAPRPELYYSLPQAPSTRLNLMIRTERDAALLAPLLRERIWRVDKDQPVTGFQTIEALVAESVAEPRFRTLLLAAFAALGVILALVGIYGVVSYAVSLRTKEIGIRVAIGAQRTNVLQLVIGHGLRIAGLGVAIGLLAALLLTRFLASLLYGVSARDPWIFGGVSILLASAALLACYIPARRAMKVDPLVALRYE